MMAQSKGAKSHTINNHDRVYSVSCECGWKWNGNRENGGKLALRLHQKKCPLLVVGGGTVRPDEMEQRGRGGGTGVGAGMGQDYDKNGKKFGKKARKKAFRKEARNADAEIRENDYLLRCQIGVERGEMPTPTCRREWEICVNTCVLHNIIAIITDDNGVPIGICGDKETEQYKVLAEALRRDGFTFC